MANFILFTKIKCKSPMWVFWLYCPVHMISSLGHARTSFTFTFMPVTQASPCCSQHLLLSGTVNLSFLIHINRSGMHLEHWFQLVIGFLKLSVLITIFQDNNVHARQFPSLWSNSWLFIFWFLLHSISQSAFVYRKLINSISILCLGCSQGKELIFLAFTCYHVTYFSSELQAVTIVNSFHTCRCTHISACIRM